MDGDITPEALFEMLEEQNESKREEFEDLSAEQQKKKYGAQNLITNVTGKGFYLGLDFGYMWAQTLANTALKSLKPKKSANDKKKGKGEGKK